ncbi:MFS transporter [Salinilacihabitans rarus]|uniref:MFS transporter n=1 Tax=Salinilacihabitans rarus TaxID=2961596 RepID=UPI0020C83C59|nr:MFS transporter [Salinilacihabitans rarus]
MDANDRALTAFAMVGHAAFHTYELVIPIFVVVWLDVYTTTAASLGAVVGASYALTGLGALPSGVLADRYGSKRLVVGCLAGMGASFAAVSVAPNLAVLTVALLAWGASASLYHPAGLSLLSRGAKARGTAFAYHGAAGNVGVAVGPLLAATLLAFVHWRVVAAALVAPVAVALLLVVRLEFDETAGSEARNAALASDGDGRGEIRDLGAFVAGTKALFAGGFAVVFAIGILYGLYYRGVLTFLPDVLADVPRLGAVELAGREFESGQYVYSGLLLLGGLGQYVGGRVVDRVRAERALVGAYGLLAALALAFVPAATAGLVPLAVVAGLLGLAVFGVSPINQEVVSAYTAADVRGLSFGYTYAALFGVGALGATLAGIVLTYATPTVLFAVLAAFAGAAAVLGTTLARRCPSSPDGGER